MNRRGAVVAVVVVLALGLAIHASGTRRTSGPPLDPRSTSEDGTRALVELLEVFGVDVRIERDIPAADTAAVLVLADRLTDDQADDLGRFVERGGRLVVADPRSPFSAPIADAASTPIRRGVCDVDALDGVTTLDGQVVSLVAGDASCFGSRESGVVSVAAFGDGAIVSVGGPDLFVNGRLDDADNAALAVALLAPRSGGSVTVLEPATPGTGERTLVDLIDTPVRALLFQLPIAFVFVVLWRGRRLGHPVVERSLVTVEASELTRAAGRLFARNGDPARAAAVVREDAWYRLRQPLGIRDDSTQTEVVADIAAATGWTPAEVGEALFDPVRSDTDLLRVATAIARLRTEVLT